MIQFYCLECGRKFQVNDEFAGRSTRCVACKSPLQVPLPSRTEASLPIARLVVADGGGTLNGERVGALASATVAYQPSAETPDTLGGDKPVAELIASDGKTQGRYLIDREIARGGMGAVLRGIDRDIRREIAVKVMLDDRDPRKQARFVEEAQITGQLEHPNIVPVHELGLDEQRRPFFTMKMVKGRSLDEILKHLCEPGAAAAGDGFTLGRLLTILVNVCHALGYAHSRRVIHRDLKPANVMVGDFGEVYVMDWGLAKVLEETPLAPSAEPLIVPTPLTARYFRPPAPEPSGTAVVSGTSRVSTSRQEEADLTQDGSILGTPAYMAPEQALGRIHDIDQRSDVYALGGLLYAMLTLKPPVEKGGGQATLLHRVAQGEIKKPEERTPGRAIPPELSAIAMKALAKEPRDRYQTVEAFRKDVELFLEGRSVSAKQDTFQEQAWKLMKRNKGASIATAAALVVLFVVAGVFMKVNYDARVTAEDNHAAFLKEAERRRGAIPSFLTAARLLIDRLDFAGARAQVGLILEIDPEHLQARFVRAQLALVAQEFDKSRDDLKAYRKARPDDPQARDLLAFLPRAQAKDEATQLLLADIFSKHHEHALATGAVQSLGENTLAARQKALELYQARIDKFWPGRGKSLVLHKEGVFHLNLTGHNHDLTDLSPLRGLPLTALSIRSAGQIRDISALKGLPLKSLTLWTVPFADLSPIRDMPLESLFVAESNVADLSPLKDMKLKTLAIDRGNVTDLSPLKDIPLTKLRLNILPGVSDLSPLYRLQLTELTISATHVRDLSPLQRMPLKTLNISGTWVTDLTPIKKLPLTSLDFGRTNISDLSPLAGMHMHLQSLKCHETRVADLSPLKGMPLAVLHCEKTPISDLTPLKGMHLRTLSFSPGNITKGIEAIRNMKSLTRIGDTVNTIIPAAEFWKRYDAGAFRK